MGYQLSNTAPHGATRKQNNGVKEIIQIKKLYGVRTMRAAPSITRYFRLAEGEGRQKNTRDPLKSLANGGQSWHY